VPPGRQSHNLLMTVMGAALLWFGWLGFIPEGGYYGGPVSEYY
jgi:ammonia channel protein AmtB